MKGNSELTDSAELTRPHGRAQAICFANGKAFRADMNQGDGNMNFEAMKEDEMSKIRAGYERDDFVEAVGFGS